LCSPDGYGRRNIEIDTVTNFRHHPWFGYEQLAGPQVSGQR
jgi:hypothetical protein